MFNPTIKDTNTINLKDAACEMGESLHDAAHSAGQKVRGMLNTASDELTHAGGYVGSEIRSNPVRSSMVALGIGLLIGTLLRR